jgi:hypothetical protein
LPPSGDLSTAKSGPVRNAKWQTVDHVSVMSRENMVVWPLGSAAIGRPLKTLCPLKGWHAAL